MTAQELAEVLSNPGLVSRKGLKEGVGGKGRGERQQDKTGGMVVLQGRQSSRKEAGSQGSGGTSGYGSEDRWQPRTKQSHQVKTHTHTQLCWGPFWGLLFNTLCPLFPLPSCSSCPSRHSATPAPLPLLPLLPLLQLLPLCCVPTHLVPLPSYSLTFETHIQPPPNIAQPLAASPTWAVYRRVWVICPTCLPLLHLLPLLPLLPLCCVPTHLLPLPLCLQAEDVQFVDVREEWEYNTARLPHFKVRATLCLRPPSKSTAVLQQLHAAHSISLRYATYLQSRTHTPK